jgi:polyisoprenoid-binding protein YceI
VRRTAPLLLFALALSGAAADYEIRPSPDSRFALEVYKTGLLSGKKHLFIFETYQGVVHFDRESPERSRIEFNVEGASAVCKDTWVSSKDFKKIQSAALNDMMDVQKHPRLHFSSTRVVPAGSSQFDVEGLLTIRGIAKSVSVNVTMAERPDGALSFAGKAVVKLKDYGLKPPSAALGTIGTKNEMLVDFALIGKLRNGGK